MFLEGLPSDSAFASAIHAEKEDRVAGRRELARMRGVEYEPPTKRRVLYAGQPLGVEV